MENSLTEDDIVIRVCTRKSACFVIIGIRVCLRAVALEVTSRWAGLADVWVVVLATTAELICVVGNAGTFASNNIAATLHLQVIWASWVQVFVAACCGTPVPTASPSVCRFHLRRMLWFAWGLQFSSMCIIGMWRRVGCGLRGWKRYCVSTLL